MIAPPLPTVDPLQRSLGRLYAPDTKDKKYELTPRRMRLIPTAPVEARKLPWRLGPNRFDQGDTSECTVHAGAHALEAAPIVHALGWTREEFTSRYIRAKRADEWPGEDYDGTSFRAVCKVLVEDGIIGSYLWAFDEDTVKEFLISRGGLCFGSEWTSTMFNPSVKGAYVEPEGDVVGGHETYLRWYYGAKHYRYPDTYEFLNSWGPEWGDRALFRMKADAFRYLFMGLNGDVCLPTELPRAKVLAA
jgi:hypothetical protein